MICVKSMVVVLVEFRESIIWAAGLIEGEGCFTLHSKNHPYFLLDMTDKDVVYSIKNIFPFLNLRGPYKREGRVNKDIWRVDAFGPKCYALMIMVYPFLHLRRQQKIRDLIDLWKARNV